MTARMTDEERIEARERAIFRSDDRFMDRMDRRWTAAEQMIGELCREGRKILYVFPVGGKYREGSRA
ncbi:hypothetical protein LB579_31555, partial [Mesorhizobium sp. BR1-1-7]|uniref:hypothetical protein n=1 Tax=Mesorhizobium sp. BR1-1-7 TaxID=2876647 RepID=UPI001CC9F0C0